MRRVLTAGGKTAALAAERIADGVDRGLIVMRHAARHYDSDNLMNEPFMSLTDTGRSQALDWGRKFPVTTRLNLFSSHIGRCIETAYLIDKGFLAAGGQTRTNLVEQTLSPFYVADAQRLFAEYLPLPDFFARWFAAEIPADVILPPAEVVRAKQAFWRQRLANGRPLPAGWDVCVTHDWNIYLIFYEIFGIPMEEQDKVEYLEGVVVYPEADQWVVTAPGQKPVVLKAGYVEG